MKQIKRWHDVETGEIVTAEQLYAEYIDLMNSGDVERVTFAQYAFNCLTRNNGTLNEID